MIRTLVLLLPLTLFSMHLRCDAPFLTHMASKHMPPSIDLSKGIRLIPTRSRFELAHARILLHQHALFIVESPTKQQRVNVEFSFSAKPVIKNGALYAQHSRVESFTIAGLPPLAQQLLALTLTAALQNYYQTEPLYKLSDALNHTLHAKVKAVVVRTNELDITLEPM